MVTVLLAMISVAVALPTPGLASTALDLPGCREHTLHRNDDESSEIARSILERRLEQPDGPRAALL